MSLDPIVVTGLGAVTPLGADVASTWEGLLSGRSGVRLLTDEWAAPLSTQIAATLPDDALSTLERVEARTLDRSAQMALVAAREAWAQAGAPEVDPERLAVSVASGVGGITSMLAQHETFQQRGPRAVSPYLVPMMMPNGPAATVGLALGARAGVHTAVSACASGAESIAFALDLIRAGRADMVVAGGTEAAIHPLTLAGFGQMRALSTRNDDPEGASRPYDKARDGFVMGEGAGILVLERLSHAQARGATVLAVLAGAAITSDAHHVTAPDPAGTAAARAITLTLRDAGLSAADLVHINAHATSTPVGDVAEAGAIRAALGEHAGNVAIAATKSQTGHLLGAAGAVEAIATVLALAERQVPAIRNLDNPDDEVDLDLVSVDPRPIRAGAALSNSFGFGGHNVCLAFTSR